MSASSDLTAALIEAVDGMRPIFEAAEGIKADMERRGWSPTAAETAALTWLNGAIARTWATP